MDWPVLLKSTRQPYKQELHGRRYGTCIGQNNHKTSKSMEREM